MITIRFYKFRKGFFRVIDRLPAQNTTRILSKTPYAAGIGETPKLAHEVLDKGVFQEKNIEIVPEPDKAVDYLFSKAETGDLLVIQPDELEPVMSQIMKRYRQMVAHI